MFPGRWAAVALLLSGILSFTGPAAKAQVETTQSALESDSKGWTDLIAETGPDMKGWTTISVPPGKQSSPSAQWSLDPASRVITCKGDGAHEWLRWDKELGDFIAHVEWRFVPIPNPAKAPRYNSGIFVRCSADGTIWHQAQTGGGQGGYLFGNTLVNGQPKRVTLLSSIKDRRVKPAGEWNTFEITGKGSDLSLWVNGAVTSEFKGCEVLKGYFGLEAEGYVIEFRSVKIKKLP